MGNAIVRRISSKKDLKRFVSFPKKLYKGNKNYVPPIEMDELNLMNPKKNPSFDDCDISLFIAERDGIVVGRVMGIISFLYNKKNNAKRVRFSRFECEDNSDTAKLLFDAVESWAREKGMDTIHGPLGFHDLDREGLMTEGFENKCIYLSAYHLPYYKKLVEENGYVAEARWVEWKFPVPDVVPERLDRVASILEKRYGIHEVIYKSDKQTIEKCGDEFFALLDLCYENIYATIPFTEKLRQNTIKLFKRVINKDYLVLVYNKEEKLIGFGIGFPSLSDALNKSEGGLFPLGAFRLLKAIKKPTELELGLIAVHPDYQKMGVTALIISNMLKRIKKNGIKVCHAACELETNTPVQRAFEMMERYPERRRVCYVKKL